MTGQDDSLPALGQPAAGGGPDADPDFAGEHGDTAVDEDITAGRDDREEESPGRWSGLDRDAPP
jgi:hypothetical protein